jgi:hypothetical protein
MARKPKKKGKRPDRAHLPSLFEPYVWSWFEEAFEQASPPQVASWPKIAQGSNTLIFSPTGSGKTLAAFLWCINDLFAMGSQQELEDAVHVLYISPLKALDRIAGLLAGMDDAGKPRPCEIVDIGAPDAISGTSRTFAFSLQSRHRSSNIMFILVRKRE